VKKGLFFFGKIGFNTLIETKEKEMTENQIEMRVEARVDLLDSLLMSGRLTQAEYDEEMKRLNDLAEEQYRILSKEVAL